MAKLILIRHGESELNKNKVYFGSLDSPLTGDGVDQISLLKNIIPDYDFIYSSPLKRARKSAEILNFKDLSILEDVRLKELNFGIFEGLSYSKILEKHPHEAEKWKNEGINYRFPNGNSILDLEKSTISFVEEIKNSDKTFLLVTHLGVINAILSHYISDNINSFWKYKSELASMTIIDFLDSFPILTLFSQTNHK